MPMTSKEMVKFLQKNGFIEVSGWKGSHRKFMNLKNGRTTLVPYHNKDLGKGIVQTILKQAGLTK